MVFHEFINSFFKKNVNLLTPLTYFIKPLSLTSAALTENSVSRLEKGDNQLVSFGPFPQEENLNAHNRLFTYFDFIVHIYLSNYMFRCRMKVLTVLMNVYNRHVSFMPKVALHSLCKVCSRFGHLS